MTVAFVSGHLDLTPDEFRAHYVPELEKAIAAGCTSFVVGDAPGADTLAQLYLMDMNSRMASLFLEPLSVTVYHMLTSPRNHVDPNAILVGGFKTDAERDAAMSFASDFDIAWVRAHLRPSSRRNSGTAKNIARRQQVQEHRRIEERRSWTMHPVEKEAWFDESELEYRPFIYEEGDPRALHAKPVALPPGFKERFLEVVDEARQAERKRAAVERELRALIEEQNRLDRGV